jgi:preprotein translocase subunit SecG
MDRTDLKEKAIILGFTGAIFLPVRLLLGQYLAENWLGMLGVASAISIILMVLVKREKLGKIGQIFHRQMTKTLWGRSAKWIVLTLVIFSAYFGTTTLLVEKGNTEYFADKQIIAENFSSKIDQNTIAKLQGPQAHDIFGISQLQHLEYFLAISYAMINDTTHGWLVNLHLIMFVEQIEILGLLWFYRRAFRPKTVPA